MKKYMVADLVKELRQNEIEDLIRQGFNDDQIQQINYLMDNYGVSEEEAIYLVENWDNEAEWNDVMDTAQNLELPLTQVTDDDVEEYQETGGTDEIETSMGNAIFKWDNVAKAYVLYIALDGGIQQYKNIPRDMIKDMKSAQSFGTYYNDNLRGNESYEGCGCKPNPCEDADLAQIPSKFRSLF